MALSALLLAMALFIIFGCEKEPPASPYVQAPNLAPPTITGFSPPASTGPLAGVSQITITGTNFSKEVRYVSEGFQLPLTFKIGVSMDVFDLWMSGERDHSLLLTIDAEHPRDFAEQIRIGGEYVFLKILSLRVGYVNPADEQGIVYGIGLQKTFGGVGIGVDYAYTPFGIFDKVQRWSLQFSL